MYGHPLAMSPQHRRLSPAGWFWALYVGACLALVASAVGAFSRLESHMSQTTAATAALATKLDEIEAHVTLVSSRISQGPDWDRLQDVRAAIDSSRSALGAAVAGIEQDTQQAAQVAQALQQAESTVASLRAELDAARAAAGANVGAQQPAAVE